MQYTNTIFGARHMITRGNKQYHNDKTDVSGYITV